MDSLDTRSKRNFILQQGLDDPDERSCAPRYSALLFQPRVVAVVLLAGLVLQSPALFFALAAVLWWGALFPRWNLFDALYNRTLGARPGASKLHAAPPPRRFAQTLAGGFSLAIAVCLILGHRAAAYTFEGVFAVAVLALAFGRFCLGSFVYHTLRGRFDFARRTLPWAGGG